MTISTRSIAALIATILPAFVLAGCGANTSGLGEAVSATSAIAGDAVATTGSSASASPSASKDSGFNPFSDGTTPPTRLREVIAKPTLAQVMQPGPLPEMSLGRADAPVTIIKYASMTCPYCRKFQAEVFPKLKRDYIDRGKVRLILREFPIGHQSGMATVALRCVPASKYFQAYDRLMAQQSKWVSQAVRTEPILKVASGAGLTRAQFDACRQNQSLIGALKAIKDRGRTLGIIGTPNFFINARLIKTTLDYAALKAIIDPLLAGDRQTAQKS